MGALTNAKALPSSAVKAAAKDVAKDDEPAPADMSGSGGFRALVWALVVLDVLALGGYLWLRFGYNGSLKKTISQSKSNLVRLKTELVELDDVVRRIQRDQVQQVDDPGTLLGAVAARMKIGDSLNTDRPLTARFGKSGYEETTVRFTFRNRANYPFSGEFGIMNFFTQVEKANPSIQIKEINFGERQVAALPGSPNANNWEVKSGVVRVLKQKSGG